MQQIYRQSDKEFEVYTTVFSPQVCRTRTRTVEADQVVVAVMQYQSRWPKVLNLNRGDLIQVLFRRDQNWWFGRLTEGAEGYFPAACVEPLQGGDSSIATPTMLRRGSEPITVATKGAPCGCTSAHSTPRLLRKDGARRSVGHDVPSADVPHNSPSLLRRVLAKTRRKSCPHLSHGSINTAFQSD